LGKRPRWLGIREVEEARTLALHGLSPAKSLRAIGTTLISGGPFCCVLKAAKWKVARDSCETGVPRTEELKLLRV
jgi:hypothetical protein